jgi:hypothetical protein
VGRELGEKAARACKRAGERTGGWARGRATPQRNALEGRNALDRNALLYMRNFKARWRPYRVECTGSLPTSEVKRHRARLVLGWGTAWEVLRVLPAFLAGQGEAAESRQSHEKEEAKCWELNPLKKACVIATAHSVP